MYCVKCRRVTDTIPNSTEAFMSKNNTPMIRGRYVVCGGTKTGKVVILLAR